MLLYNQLTELFFTQFLLLAGYEAAAFAVYIFVLKKKLSWKSIASSVVLALALSLLSLAIAQGDDSGTTYREQFGWPFWYYTVTRHMELGTPVAVPYIFQFDFWRFIANTVVWGFLPFMIVLAAANKQNKYDSPRECGIIWNSFSPNSTKVTYGTSRPSPTMSISKKRRKQHSTPSSKVLSLRTDMNQTIKHIWFDMSETLTVIKRERHNRLRYALSDPDIPNILPQIREHVPISIFSNIHVQKILNALAIDPAWFTYTIDAGDEADYCFDKFQDVLDLLKTE